MARLFIRCGRLVEKNAKKTFYTMYFSGVFKNVVLQFVDN